MFAYLNIIQPAHKTFLGLAWLAYDLDFRRRAARDPTVSWKAIHPQFYLEKFSGMSRPVTHGGWGGRLFGSNSPSLFPQGQPIPIWGPVPQLHQGFSCVRSPCPFTHCCSVPGCGEPTLQQPTQARALESLQSQVIPNADDFLLIETPKTPVNINLLENYLEGHPDPSYRLRIQMYVTVDYTIQLLLYLGKGAVMSKTNVHSAFQTIPVHPLDW